VGRSTSCSASNVASSIASALQGAFFFWFQKFLRSLRGKFGCRTRSKDSRDARGFAAGQDNEIARVAGREEGCPSRCFFLFGMASIRRWFSCASPTLCGASERKGQGIPVPGQIPGEIRRCTHLRTQNCRISNRASQLTFPLRRPHIVVSGELNDQFGRLGHFGLLETSGARRIMGRHAAEIIVRFQAAGNARTAPPREAWFDLIARPHAMPCHRGRCYDVFWCLNFVCQGVRYFECSCARLAQQKNIDREFSERNHFSSARLRLGSGR